MQIVLTSYQPPLEAQKAREDRADEKQHHNGT